MKRRPADHRTIDLFAMPVASQAPGSLAGLKARIAHQLSATIRDSGMDRYAIAARMSALLGEDVPKVMLDAYTAESREDQNIPAHRLLALILATGDFVALDALAQTIGCRVLAGDDVELAAITEAEAQRAALDQHIREMKRRHKEKRR